LRRAGACSTMVKLMVRSPICCIRAARETAAACTDGPETQGQDRLNGCESACCQPRPPESSASRAERLSG
jgi:hypothetical protein